MIDEKKLKPCPFCGGEAELVNHHDILDDSDRIYIRCTQCKAQTQETYTSVRFGDTLPPYNPVELAVRTWNERVSQPPADNWIPCKTCDKRCSKWENSEI